MENLELRLKNAPYFRCERGDDSVPVCRKCETCVLAWKVFSTKEWFRRVGESSQTRFLVSVLAQLDSLYLLHYFQNILQTTQGKDFVYHRSRVNLSNQEGRMVKFSLNQRLDKTVEQKMRELLCWFGNSTHQMKVNYTLLLMHVPAQVTAHRRLRHPRPVSERVEQRLRDPPGLQRCVLLP